MTAESLLDRLATAVHQAALSRDIPEAVDYYDPPGVAQTPFDLQTKFVVDPMDPKDVLAGQVEESIRGLARGVVSRLGTGAKLARILHSANEHEHAEPALITPVLPVYAGVQVEDGRLIASVRIPFGVAYSA